MQGATFLWSKYHEGKAFSSKCFSGKKLILYELFILPCCSHWPPCSWHLTWHDIKDYPAGLHWKRNRPCIKLYPSKIAWFGISGKYARVKPCLFYTFPWNLPKVQKIFKWGGTLHVQVQKRATKQINKHANKNHEAHSRKIYRFQENESQNEGESYKLTHLKVSQRMAKDSSNGLFYKIRRNKGMIVHKRLGVKP